MVTQAGLENFDEDIYGYYNGYDMSNNYGLPSAF